VDGAAFDLCRRIAEPRLEPMLDLAGGFVGESEGADARRVEFEFLDEEANAFGETERLASTRTREHEERASVSFDRFTLRRRCHMSRICGGRRGSECIQANRWRARSRALRASSSRLRGGAWISSDEISRRAIAVTSSTA
jgi:predicted secreted protein